MKKREMKGFIFLLSSIYAPPTEEDFLNLPPDYLAKFIRLKSAKKHSGPCDDEWLFDGNSKCLKYENPGKILRYFQIFKKRILDYLF